MLSLTESFVSSYYDDIKQFISKLNINKFYQNFVQNGLDSEKKINEIKNKKNINTTKIEKIVKHFTKQAITDFTNSTNKKSFSFNKYINEAFQTVIKSNVVNDDIGGVSKSIILIIAILVVNYFISSILLTFGFPSNFVSNFSNIISAPLTEETAKFISVKQNFTKEFFIIFNITEFTLFIIAAASTGILTPAHVFVRLIVIGFHLLLTLIHVSARNESKKSENKDNNLPLIGLSMATVLHAVWNSLAFLR